MKTKIVQTLFIFLCTVLAAALQDMSPAFGGVKPPFLLALALHWAFTTEDRDPRERIADDEISFSLTWVLAAIFAGSFEDALSSFPTGCASGFFLLSCASARLARNFAYGLIAPVLGFVALMTAAPLHEMWLAVWGVAGNEPSAIVRFFAATIPAAAVGPLVFLIMPPLEHHVGFEGAPTDRRRA